MQKKPNPNTPIAREMAAEMIETNKSSAALLRDSERRLVRDGPPPVDLRTIPLADWQRYLNYDVTLPPEIARYLASREPGPLTIKETHSLEIAIEQHHGVEEPYYIVTDATMQSSGRAWAYEPETAPLLTGFYLDME